MVVPLLERKYILLKNYSMCITIHIERCAMRTNIVLDDNLVDEAFKYANEIHTKKELIEVALREFVNSRKMKNIKDLKGKIVFADDYDYKKMRIAR
jgi:Arc/MetJ family transcription regulator